MTAYRNMECGPCGEKTPHAYKGDCWRCLPCESRMLSIALRNLRCVAVSQGVSEQHGVIVNADGSLRYAGGSS